MCGIAGVISLSSGGMDKAVLKRMTDVITHRGPDGEGAYVSNSFMFGHRRLSIVDVSDAGHQPMQYLERYVITYNGEIYNHLELREELEELGYIFKSHTDTEIIMAAFDRWGIDCFKRFNGMWALVLYDSQEHKFLISRDRFGIKPLYYYLDSELFVFASEIKAILLHPKVKINPNSEYLSSYLENGAQEWLENTAFDGIRRFPISSYIIASDQKLIQDFSPTKFWHVTPNLTKEKFSHDRANEIAKKYYDLLSDAVRLRLRADVKIGSALSGGLDSSSIVYLVNKHLKLQEKEKLQETFSSVYKSKETSDCDESIYIDQLAKYLNVNSNQIEPKELDVPLAHKKVIWAMENPPESSLMSSWHTYIKVKESNVKVTLDGQGADEQLAGYLPYIREYLLSISLVDFINEMPKFLNIPGAKRHVYISVLMRAFVCFFGELIFKNVFERLKGRKIETHLNKVLHDSTHTTLLTLIHYADHTSMAHSIESRMPFMDYRLVEFLASVPACYKMHNGWTKYIARLAFDKRLPDNICWRKDKMGWSVPEDYWFRGNLRGWLIEQVKSSSLTKSIDSESDIISLLDSGLPIKHLIRRLNLAITDHVFFSSSRGRSKEKI